MNGKMGAVIKEIIKVKGIDAFQNAKYFNALFDDFGYELIDERKILHRELTDELLQRIHWVFCAENISRENEIKKVQHIMCSELGMSENWANTIIVGFADAFDMSELCENLTKTLTVTIDNADMAEDLFFTSANQELRPLLKRVLLFLEDGDYKNADEYCERILDIEPENSMAYLGKLLSELHLSGVEQLKDCDTSFSDNSNYKKAIKFADETLRLQLSSYAASAEEKAILKKKSQIYRNAINLMSKNDYNSLCEARKLFDTILDFKDAEDKAREVIKRAENIRKETVYQKAVSMIKETEKSNRQATEMLHNISGYKDSDTISAKCQKKADDLRTAYTHLAKLREITDKQNELETKRKSLGFFNGKEKNRIAAELEQLNLEQQNITGELNNLDVNYNRAAIAYRLSGCKRGSTFTYGTYNRTPILWLTLYRVEDRILAITYDCLERIKFSKVSATWDKCMLRKWLNDNFYNSAFNQDEKKNIMSVKLQTPPTKEHRKIISGGEDTIDKIFCLSVGEVKKYMPNISDRRARDLQWSANGYTYPTLGWWTRSPGYSVEYGADVRSHTCSESPGEIGCCVEKNSEFVAVRPAMWINIEL